MKEVHKTIKLNQNAWLQSYIDMSIGLRKKAKNAKNFEKDYFKFMNYAVFGKSIITIILKTLLQKCY